MGDNYATTTPLAPSAHPREDISLSKILYPFKKFGLPGFSLRSLPLSTGAIN